MCKYVLIGLLVFLVVLMVAAALVVQEYGWTGFLVLLGALVVVGYVARKLLPRLFMYMLTRPMRMMGAALRGGRIEVHSVDPCAPPTPEELGEGPDAIDDEDNGGGHGVGDEDEDADEEEPAVQLDWYEVEFSVIPPGDGSSEGRILTRPGWTAQLIGAVGPRSPLERSNPFRGWPPPDQFPDTVQNLPPDVWTGYDYEQPEQALYGEHRLRMRVGVARRVRAVTITYAHFTDLGEVRLPRIDVSPEDET